MDKPDAKPKSAWRVIALAIGWILLAAAPLALSYFDQEIDDRVHIAEAWPDFWGSLAQIKAWWFGGVVLAAVFIGSRVLVNKLRARSRFVWYRIAAAIWWSLLAVAPFVLIVIILRLRINHRLDDPNLTSDVRDLLVWSVMWWAVGVILIAAFVGARGLRALSMSIWKHVGTAIWWLLLVIGPPILMAFAERSYSRFNGAALGPDGQALFSEAQAWWLCVSLVVAIFFGGGVLVKKLRAGPNSVWRRIAVAALMALGLYLLLVAPRQLIAFIDGFNRGQNLAGISFDTRVLLREISAWWSAGVLSLAIIFGVRALENKLRGQSEPAWYLILTAVGWLLLALAPSLLIGFVGEFSRTQNLTDLPSDVRNLLRALADPWFVGMHFVAALVQGRIIGRGNIRDGLGDAPVSKLPFIRGLALQITAYAAFVNIILYLINPELNSIRFRSYQAACVSL